MRRHGESRSAGVRLKAGEPGGTGVPPVWSSIFEGGASVYTGGTPMPPLTSIANIPSAAPTFNRTFLYENELPACRRRL